MSRLAPALLLAAAGLITGAPGAFAQQTVNTASVGGRVTDVSGGAIAGAKVVARETATNVSIATTADAGGRFRLPYLHVGAYELVVTAKGFSPAVQTLQLEAGAAFDLPIALSVASITTTVSVSAASELETARSQVATTIMAAEVRNLPMNGRNFLDLALLAPGASPVNIGGGTQMFPETSAVPGVGLSVGSQRNLSNNFVVDGLSDNDDAAALSGLPYSVDAVDEFQVITSGGQAELGRALGGDVSVVTKSGTNTFKGDAFEFFRDDALNAPNALSGSVLPMRQHQFGGSAGGPIRHDRTFFFGNIEARRFDQTGLVTIPAATASAIDAHLAAVGYPGPGVATGVYPDPIDSTMALGKVDDVFSPADQFTVRESLYHVTSPNSNGAGGTAAPSASAGLVDTDESTAVSNVRTLSPHAVLETRAQFAYGTLSAPPSDPVGPTVSISGVASFGTLKGAPTARVNKTLEIVNNFSYQAGAHAIRAGADVLYNDTAITFPRSSRGNYSFASLASFLTGTYNTSGFVQTFGQSAIGQTNPNLGVYLQDEWAAASRVTINAGLRYDLQYLETIATDTNNVAPRLGLVWTLGHTRRTVIRTNGGRYYDRVPLRPVANALLSADNTTDPAQLRQINVKFSPGQTGAPVFPAILTDQTGTSTAVEFLTMDRHIQNAYSNQASVEIEREIGAGGSLTVGYDHIGGHNLIAIINLNAPTCAVSGGNNGCRPTSTFGNDSQYSSVGRSSYNGVHVSFSGRPAASASYRVSYTLSKALDDVGEAFSNGPIDNSNIMSDWGRSDDDQRHRLVAMATLRASGAPGGAFWDRLARGFQLTTVLQWYSAPPFNIVTGANTVQGTAARPAADGAFIQRNAGVGSDFFTVNLRLTRSIGGGARHADLMIEAFNLFNRENVLATNTTFGTGAYPANPAPTYGQVTVVGEPRTLQLGLRLAF